MPDNEILRVPHEFVPGTPAKALEVNEDMDYLLRQTAPAVDEVTVSRSASEQLQAIGFRESNSNLVMQPYYCTKEEYAALEREDLIDDNTLYILNDDADLAYVANTSLSNLDADGSTKLASLRSRPFSLLAGNVNSEGYSDLLYAPSAGDITVPWEQPIMSSNTSWGTLSSSFGNAYYLFDGKQDTKIITQNGFSGTITVTWVMPEVVTFTKCTVSAPAVSGVSYAPTGWRVYCQNQDNLEWIEIGSCHSIDVFDLTKEYSTKLNAFTSNAIRLEVDCAAIESTKPTVITSVLFEGTHVVTANGSSCYFKVGGSYPDLKYCLSDAIYSRSTVPSVNVPGKTTDFYNCFIGANGPVDVLSNWYFIQSAEPKLVELGYTVYDVSSALVAYEDTTLVVKGGTTVYIPDGRDEFKRSIGRRYTLSGDANLVHTSKTAGTWNLFLLEDGTLGTVFNSDIFYVDAYEDMPEATASNFRLCYVQKDNRWYCNNRSTVYTEFYGARVANYVVNSTPTITSLAPHRINGAQAVWQDTSVVPTVQRIFTGEKWEVYDKVILGHFKVSGSTITDIINSPYDSYHEENVYRSPLYQLTLGVAINDNHSLNLSEDQILNCSVIPYLKCIKASDGYAVNDILKLTAQGYCGNQSCDAPFLVYRQTTYIPTPNQYARYICNKAGTAIISATNITNNFRFGYILKF